MKRKTKKKLKMVVVWSLLVVMMLSLLTGLIPRQSETVTTDPKLMQAFLDSQNPADEEEILPNIEGNYIVNEVVDGSSLSIMWGDEERTVKLIGVDVPRDMEKKAVALLKNELPEESMVSLEFDVLSEDEDGNLLAYIYRPEDVYTSLNSKLIVEGLAKVNDDSENTKYIEDLRSAENVARENEVGCWAKPAAEEDKNK